MDAQATTPGEDRTTAPSWMPDRGGLVGRIAAGVVAAVLLLLALGAPLWTADLSAPQYPAGLRLAAYGDRVEGDIKEITELNHYVGMRPYAAEDLPEMKLWVPTVLAALLAVGVSVAFGKRWPGRLARLFVWGVPFGILADVQFRLYQYGHDLQTDPRPALHMDPFTPLVVGSTHVMNFTTRALPGLGVILFVVAAFVLSFGPAVPSFGRRIARWFGEPVGPRDGEPTPAEP